MVGGTRGPKVVELKYLVTRVRDHFVKSSYSRRSKEGWGGAQIVVEALVGTVAKELESGMGIVSIGEEQDTINTRLKGCNFSKTMSDNSIVGAKEGTADSNTVRDNFGELEDAGLGVGVRGIGGEEQLALAGMTEAANGVGEFVVALEKISKHLELGMPLIVISSREERDEVVGKGLGDEVFKLMK
jgi:hypothetical protein